MKKFWKSPWTIAIVPVVIGFVLTVIYDYAKGKNFPSTLVFILSSIWKGVISFLNLNLKVWWILLGIIALILIFIFIVFILSSRETSTAEWLQYKEDTIDGFHWKWRWGKDDDGLFNICDLHPVCSRCNTPYVPANDYRGGPICPRCKHRPYNQLPDLDNVEVIIRDNVNRMIEKEKSDNNNELQNK